MELRDLYDANGKLTNLTYKKGDKIPEGYYPMVVMIAIENNNNEFLMQKRVKEKGGDWGVTGGHPKSGETPYEGIITEVKEELGIDISGEKIIEFNKNNKTKIQAQKKESKYQTILYSKSTLLLKAKVYHAPSI